MRGAQGMGPDAVPSCFPCRAMPPLRVVVDGALWLGYEAPPPVQQRMESFHARRAWLISDHFQEQGGRGHRSRIERPPVIVADRVPANFNIQVDDKPLPT